MKRSFIALALAAILPFSAQAAELSYSYVEADYVNLDSNVDGWGLRGSVAFNENFYGLAGYTNIDAFGINVDGYEVGLGYHYGISDKTDLIGELAYQNASGGGANADGYRASFGVRGQLSDKFEGILKANYIDGSNFNGNFSGTVGAQVKFNDTWGVTGEVEFANSDTAYLLGLRARF